MNIEPPKKPTGDAQQDILALWRWLYRLCERLNLEQEG